MTGPDRTPEELRGDLQELRAEVGDSVEELANRLDVPARARAKKDETVELVQQQVVKARENPLLVGGAALAAALIVFLVLRPRSQTA